MDGANAMKTPFSSSFHLTLHDGAPMKNPQVYKHTVGALQYASLTRPDIAF